MPGIDLQMLLSILQLVGLFGTGGLVAVVLQHILGIRTLDIEYRRKTRETILGEIRDYVVRLHAPVSQAASALAHNLKEPTSDGRSIFFLYCHYRACLAAMWRETRAGVILSRYDAELAVVRLMVMANAEIRSGTGFTPYDLAYIELKVPSEMKLVAFRDLLSSDTGLSMILEKFKAWLDWKPGSMFRAAEYLQAISDVLIYEANVILEPWYRTKPPPLSRKTIDIVRRKEVNPNYRLGVRSRVCRRITRK
jgi:hypothetical protein